MNVRGCLPRQDGAFALLEKALVSSVGPFRPVATWHFKRGLAALSPHVVTPEGGVPPSPPCLQDFSPVGSVFGVWFSSGALGHKTAGFGAGGRLPKLGTPASLQVRAELDSHPRDSPPRPLPGPGPGWLDCTLGRDHVPAGWSWRPSVLAPSPRESPRPPQAQ